MKKNVNIRELERWLKSSLKNKISIDSRSVIAYLMMGFAGLMISTVSNAGWTTTQPIKVDGDNNSRISVWDATGKTGDGSVILSRSDRINKELVNSVVIGTGGNKPGQSGTLDTQKLAIDIEGYDPSNNGFNSGIVAIGSVRVHSNPHGVGRTGTGGQAVAIGNDVTSTSQAVAIGNNTYALGGSSIAIGNDDIETYRDKVTAYDYKNYLKPLYDKIDPGRNAYGIGDAGNAIYSPNVAGGEGSISIGSRSVAYKPGSTALGTLAYALGQGATALGTQSRAEGKGSIAIGNETRNFADQALAIGNNSQILATGGTAVGLRARSGGEGSIAIGTDVYANAAMNNTPGSPMDVQHNALKTRVMGTDNLSSVETTVSNSNTINPTVDFFHDIGGIIKGNGKNALVIGTRSAALGSNSIALGRGAFAMEDNSFGIGSYSYANKMNSMAIGTSSRALAQNAITLGAGSVTMTDANSSTVIGTKSAVAGENSSLVGANSQIYGSNSLIFGNNTNILKKGSSSSNNNVAIGNDISIGSGVINSMAYGSGAMIGDKDNNNNNISNSTAFGNGASVIRQYTGPTVDNMSPAAIKNKAVADPMFMYTGNNAMAIGNNSQATLENSVALGVNSSTDYTYLDLLQPGWTARGSIAIPTSGQTGVISVGSKGAERRIVNVASGFRDTDAVNVIQLRTLEEKIDSRVDGIESGMHYLSVNKKGSDSGTLQGSETVTELIERRKNYDLYLRYKTQELQIKAREEWKGEKFDTDSKKKITDKIAEIEAADTTGLIRHTASDLRNITVTALPSGADIQAEYTRLVRRIDDAVKTSTTDAKYTALVGGVNIEDLQNETNYSNKGANGTDSLAIGFRASTKKDNTVDSKQAIAMGYRASAENVNALAIGSVGDDITKASGISSIAIGNGTQTTSNYSVGLGGNAQVKGDTSIAIGDRTLTTASRATAVGPAAKGLGTNSVALGASAETGFLSKTETNGDKTYTGANYSTAIGGGATVYSNYSVAIGNGATVGETVTTSGVTTLKTDAKASVVLGSGSKSTAEGGTVLGADAKATFKNSVALGRNVTTTESNGNSYLTNRAFNDKGYVVSVGNRRINQLEDGAEDTDAVTVRQLKALENKTLTTDNAKITIAPDQNGTKEFTLGSTINLKTDDSWTTGTERYVGDNLETYKKNNGDILIGFKEEPKFKTLKLNNGASGSQDLTLSADNTGNLNVGSKKITGVADGTGNNDAVNYSQLNSVKSIADTAKATADTAKNTANAAQTTANAANTAVTNLGNKGLTFTANSGTNITRKLGETVGIKGDNSTISTSTNTANNEITIKVKDGGIGTTQLANGAVTEAKLADNAVTTGKIKDGAVTGAKLADDLNNKINNANKVATNNMRLTGDSNSKTSDVALNKSGGVEFAINGKSGEIVTKASGTKVEIGLDSTIKAKLDKLSTDPNATYATKTELDAKANKNLGNIGTEGQNAIKDQARKAVVVEAGNGIEVETTEDNANHKTKYTVKINDTTMNKIGTGEVAANDENTVTGGKVNTYLTQNYLTKTNVTGTVKAADGSPITVNKGTNDSNGKEYTIDVKKSDITGTGGITVTNGTGKVLGENGVQLSIADKAITFNKLDDDLQTKINSVANKASTLKIGTGTASTETVNLSTDTVKINGSDGVTVSLNNKEFTVGLDQTTKDKINNVGKSTSDGRDGLDGTNGHNGSHGLTAKDGLNGKDLTTKVNALRNGEAGTVVFTDAQGKRLAKANDGKYYPADQVGADGNIKTGVTGTPVTNPELRVVNADGSTTTPNTLNNLASGLGLDGKKPGTNPGEDYAKPISVGDAQTVVKGLATQTEGLNKAATVRDLQALTNAGLTFEANTVGDTTTTSKVDRKLGETLKITGDGIKVSKNATNDGFVFSLSKGKVDTVNVKDKAVTSAKLAEDARTVVYITPDNKVVELGADGKLHKAEDLQGKTYVVVKTPQGTIDEAKTGYYSDNDVNADGELKTTTAQKLETPAVVNPQETRLRHALNGYTAGGTDITTKSVLTNVGAGNIAADSTDAINGSQLKDVADKVGLTVGNDNKTLTLLPLTGLKDSKGVAGAAPQSIVTGLNAVTDKVNEGIQYNGDLGTKGTQQLGSVFNVNRAGTGVELKDGTKQTISKIVPVPAGSAEGTLPTIGTEEIDRKYVGKNIITQYTKNTTTGDGKLEIGFAESPEFKNVKADNVTTGSIVFDDGAGHKLSLGPTSDGKLQVGGKEISTELVLSKDGTNEHGKVDLAKQKLHVAGKNEVEVEISGQKVTVGLSEATKQKLDNLDENANDKYAKKDATNIDAAKWKEKLGLSNAVSGTGKLAIDTATKGTAAGATAIDGGKAEVSLDGTQNFKMIGTEGVTVSANDKNITFGLDPETINKINNAGSKKDGKDGKNGANALNGTNGDAGASGNHGLTGKDGLNGADLTDKVNALRNGEAGTVVFTDAEGHRLVKANDGKYYPADQVGADGNIKTGVTGTPVTNPELRVVNADGSTTTPNKLSNIANGKIDANSKDAINGSQIKDVLNKLGVETDANGTPLAPTITALNKADGTPDTAKTTLKDGLNAVIGKVNEGIKYKGDLGTEGTQQLGSVFNVNRAENALTKDTVNYVGDNLITQYTRNADGSGKLEIGFKESPTFKDVTANKVTAKGDITAGGNVTGKDGKFDNLKVTEKITTKEIEFKDGTGNNLTLVSGKDGNLYINGVAVPSAANAPVIYTNTNGERVELGQDGKVYKPSDLTGFTYVKGVNGFTDGYYADNQFQKDDLGAFIKDNEGNKVLKTGEQPTTLLAGKDYTGEVLHKLSPLNKTDNNPRRLVNVAAGKDNTDAVNVGQLNAVKDNTIKLTGDGNTSTDTQKLGKENGLAFGVNGSDAIETNASGSNVTVKLKDEYKTKLDNLDTDAKNTYAKKDATNIDAAKWKEKLGLSNAVSGTGTLSIDAVTKKDTTETNNGKATVSLNGTESFKLVGTDGITVAGNSADGKTLTFGLDQTTKDKINNVGKSTSDGRDGLDGTNGHNGSHGLTAKDGLNGKDLTTKVNALRNGEAGTVVFTDAQGKRLAKANDGKYYPADQVGADGNIKTGVTGTPVTNPELRVVNADGSTTTPNTLNNLASGLGLDGKKPGTNPGEDYAKPISVGDAQTVVKGLATQTEGLNKAATVRDLQALTNAGLTFEANTVGDTTTTSKVDRKLGETLKITGDGIKVSKNATNDGFVFSLSKGKVDTVNVKDKAVTSAKLAEDARTVVYITPDNKVVELGADGKLHKAEDLQGKTYVVVKTPQGTIDEAKTGYYSDNDVNADGELKTTTAQKLETPAVVNPQETRLRHALNGYTAGGTDITTKSVLTNVGAGNIAADSTDAINGSQLKDVADKVGLTVGNDNKTLTLLPLTGLKDSKGVAGAAPQSIVTGLNAVTDKVNEGIQYNGDLGTKGTQQLGSVFNVNRAGTGVELKDGTKQTISKIVPVPAGSAEGTLPTIGTEEIDRKYVGKNIITQYTKNTTTGDGKLEIGFAESPEFKNVKADNVTTGSIVFDDGAGHKLSLGPTSDGKLQVGGKEISTELVLSKDGTNEHGKVDLAKQKLHVAGKNEVEVEISGQKVTVGLSEATKQKLDNLDENANDKYAKKDATNIDAAKWKEKLGLSNAVSGTGKLAIDTATKGTAAGATAIDGGKAEVSLDGTQNFKMIGTEGVTVSANDKNITFGLDPETINKINNAGSKKDGKDGKNGANALNGTNGDAGASGNHGLTGKDGLNGADLTDKVNALRNGEAGTVVFTDAEGHRLVKANDGKYYPADQVGADGNIKTGVTGTPVTNPELRVVNADGSTTTPNKLSNIANGKIDANSKDAINGSQIKDVLNKLGVETDANGTPLAPTITALNKADGTPDTAKTTLKDGLNAVIGKVNEGIKYKGDLGTEGTQQLGSVFNVNRAENALTKDTVNYVGDNLITKYTRNADGSGKLEIGFKESPTFKDVTADKVTAKGDITAGGNVTGKDGKFDNLKVTEKITTKEIEFKDGTGNNLTLVSGKDGNLYINGVAVPSAANAPVIYTNTNGERVELGQDGKVYKPSDLTGFTYVKGVNGFTDGYYADNQFQKDDLGAFIKDNEGNKVLKTGEQPTTLLAGKDYTGEVLHKLSPLNKTDNNPRRLVNVAAGKDNTDAVNVGQLNAVKDLPITFQGDKATDTVTRKLGETLKITGDGVKVTKNATGDGLVLSIDQGKVQTKNVADQAVTSAKLAQDARTVVYVTQNNEPVELGADNKLYKSADLQGKTYIVSTDPTIQSGYYADGDLNADKTAPLAGKTPATLTAINPDPTVAGGQQLKHALNGYVPGGTNVTTKSVLTNVGAGDVSKDSTDAINGGQFYKVAKNTVKLTADGITPAAGGAKTNTETTALNLDNNGGISFGIKGADGIETSANGTDVTVKLSSDYKNKLDNLDPNANTKYATKTELDAKANKDASNLDNLSDAEKQAWRTAIGLGNAVSGTGKLAIDTATKGTAAGATAVDGGKAEVSLDGTQNFKMIGTEGVTVSANDKNITFGLDPETINKINNAGSKKDGKDGKNGANALNGTNGDAGASGNHGLTGKDGLNGADLTDKVNALRNGEAGTVVFTDAEGHRLVKANDGKYYPADQVGADGNIKTGVTGTPVTNPELRVVNADGSTTTPNKLSNIANGKIDANSKDAINGSQIKDVLNKLGVETDANGTPLAPTITALNKADGTPDTAKTTLKDGLNAVIGKVNEGIKYKGDLGTEGTQQLGSVFNVNRAENALTKDTVNYVGDNLITQYTRNADGSGKLEIGFKESPTFKDVTANKVTAKGDITAGGNVTGKDGKFDNLKVTEKITTKEIEFKDGTGNNLTLVSGKDGNLYINGVAVPSAANAPVIYTNTNGERVELGQDGKVYKPSDLTGFTYVKGVNGFTDGYYADNQFQKDDLGAFIKDNEGNKVLKTGEQPTTLLAGKDYTGEVLHKLSPLNKTDNNPRRLVNVAAGKDNTDAVNVGQLNAVKDLPITFQGDKATDTVTRKLGETLKITGDGVKVTKNATGDGLVLSIDQGKVQTKNVADQAVTSAKLAQDARTVVYVTQNNEPVELGADNKLYKSADLQGKTYIVSTDPTIQSGYYADGDLNADKTAPLAGKTPATLTAINPDPTVAGGQQLKHALNGYVPGGTNVTTKSVLTNVGDGTADNDAVNVKQLNALKTNTIKLDGNTGSTDKQELGKENGLSFGIKGTDGIETSANGTDVTIKLDAATKAKLDNITAVSDGRDGKDGRDGTNGSHGLTAKDGLNGKDLTTKVNALRNGEAGTVVFTDAQGKRLAKANDGKYYPADQVGADGNIKTGVTGTPVTNPELRVVNADGSTTTPNTLNNIASGLGLTNTSGTTPTAITTDNAKTAVNNLLTKTEGLNKAVNVGDLQALAQAGLDFTGNSGKAHAPLSTTVNIVGQGTTATGFTGANGNINVVASEDTANKISKLEIQLAEALQNIKSIQNQNTKITLGQDGISIAGKDGKDAVAINGTDGTNGASVVINGKDGQNGKDGVTIKGSDGTNGSSVAINGKDGKDGVSIKGTDGTNGSSIVVHGKDGAPGVTINGGNGTDGKDGSIVFAKNGENGTGSITGLKDPELNDNGTPKDKTAATTVNYVTNQIEGAKTAITNNIKNIVDGGMKYNGNSGDEVKVKLNEAVNIKGEGNYTGANSATGNIAVVGNNATSTLEIKLNKDLSNIDTISKGKTKITLGEDGISIAGKDGQNAVAINGTDGTNGASVVINGKDGQNGKDGVTIKGSDGTNGSSVAINGKDGKDGVTIKGTDGKDGSSIVVHGKDGAPGVTINGGNGTDGKYGSIVFAKDGTNGTGSITGLKDPDGTDKTAAATVNYVTNEINNVTNNINNAVNKMNKGLNFAGNDVNDPNKVVNAQLEDTVTIKGEGTVNGTTAANNIKVEKDETTGAKGLVVKLADKLTGMTRFETKEEDGKKVTIDKNGISLTTTGTPGANLKLGTDGTITGVVAKADDDTSVATVGYIKDKIKTSAGLTLKGDTTNVVNNSTTTNTVQNLGSTLEVKAATEKITAAAKEEKDGKIVAKVGETTTYTGKNLTTSYTLDNKTNTGTISVAMSERPEFATVTVGTGNTKATLDGEKGSLDFAKSIATDKTSGKPIVYADNAGNVVTYKDKDGNVNPIYKQEGKGTITGLKDVDYIVVDGNRVAIDRTQAVNAGYVDEQLENVRTRITNNTTRITELSTESRAGIAGVAAMANIPQINDASSNRYNIAVGIGKHRGETAYAVGISGVSDGGRLVYKASAALDSQNKVTTGLGLGYQFGERDIQPKELDRLKSQVGLLQTDSTRKFDKLEREQQRMREEQEAIKANQYRMQEAIVAIDRKTDTIDKLNQMKMNQLEERINQKVDKIDSLNQLKINQINKEMEKVKNKLKIYK